MFLSLMFKLVFIFFFSSVLFTLIDVAKKQNQKMESEEDEEHLVGNNNIYSKQEQAKMVKDLKMEHWDGPYPEDDFEVKKPIEYKKYDVPKEKEKKKIDLSKREALLFAMVDEPRCRKDRIR